MDSQTQSLRLTSLFTYLTAGLFGGLLIMLMEGVDRFIKLPLTISDKGFWLLALSIIPVVTMGLALLVGAVSLLGDYVTEILRQRVKISPLWVARPLAAGIISIPLLLIILAKPALAHTVQALLNDLSERGLPVASLAKFAKLLTMLAGYFVILKLVLLESRPLKRWLAQRWMLIIAFLLTIATVGGYWLSSTTFVGRYTNIFHIPLTLIVTATSLLIGIIVINQLKVTRISQLVGVLGIVFFSLLAIVGDHQAINHPVAKASFWRRGVIGKHYMLAVQHFIDRDGDGFSSYFDGGDTDDHQAKVNPLAIDIPRNGIDENGIGGDFTTPTTDLRSLNQRPLPENKAQNIIFITIDCLRADHLSCYGYKKKLSPNIDRLAEKSLVFEQAFSLGTNTGHSFSGIARANFAEHIFDDSIPTVPELFVQQGYTTASLTSPQTDKWLFKPGWESYKAVMLKGFQEVIHKAPKNWNSKKLTDHTIEYLTEHKDKPLYLWVHYNDLHAKGEKYAKQDKNDPAQAPMDVYDSNLAFTDKHLGRLLEYLETSGLINNSVVAISADHGEEFLEHGQQFHNGRPYRIQTNVPLILWYPGVKNQRITQPVSNTDVGPTFLRLTGQLPPKSYTSIDLLATVEGLAPQRPIFMETPRNVPQGDFFAWAVVEGDWRLIYDLVGNTYELFDNQGDRGEQHNLIEQEPAQAQHLKSILGAWLDEQSQDKAYRYWVKF